MDLGYFAGSLGVPCSSQGWLVEWSLLITSEVSPHHAVNIKQAVETIWYGLKKHRANFMNKTQAWQVVYRII